RNRSRYRAAYLPRTTPRMDRKSYSGRRSSSPGPFPSGEVAILVIPPFGPARLAGANEPDLVAAVGVRHDQQPAGGRQTHCNVTVFVVRVVRVVTGQPQRVREHGH